MRIHPGGVAIGLLLLALGASGMAWANDEAHDRRAPELAQREACLEDLNPTLGAPFLVGMAFLFPFAVFLVTMLLLFRQFPP